MKKAAIILGTEYKIKKKRYKKDVRFKENRVSGYCDPIEKEIVYCDMSTWPGWDRESPKRCVIAEKETLRHEIVHAFLDESGLQENAIVVGGSWASNEEMVDWIALQFPKILDVCRQLDAV